MLEWKESRSSDQGDNEGEDLEHFQRRRPSRPLSQFLRLLLGVIAVVATIILLANAYQWNAARGISQCGTTAAEARSKGCIFETMGFSWLPPDCVDAEVEEKFLSQGLRFYKDINYTLPATVEEIRQGEGAGFFVTHEYHVTHCAFLLKKLHRAYHRGGKIDGLIISLHHTSHCVHMLLDPPEDVWTHPAFAYTKYPYCGKKGGYNVEWGRQGEWTD